jgi:hypothetical protein
VIEADSSKASRQRSQSAHSDNEEKATSRATPLLGMSPEMCRI